MGNSAGAKPTAASDAHARAAPPCMMHPVATDAGAKPRTSDGAAPPTLTDPMGVPVPAGAKPCTSDGTAPPSPSNPVGTDAGVKARASDGAAQPSPMNPVGGSPTAPSSEAPCSKNLAASSVSGETTKPPEHPRRPGRADCSYYIKFGTAPPCMMHPVGTDAGAKPCASDGAAPPTLTDPMGVPVPAGAKPHASDGTAPPTMTDSVGGSAGAKHRISPTASDGAAPPSPMNPVGTDAPAPPRQPPIAAASPTPMNPVGGSSSDATCSKNPGASSGTGETTKPPEYPRRPGSADCSNYVKFGTCAYGMKCWFNHPDLPTTAGAAARGQSQASNPSDQHKNKKNMVAGVPISSFKLHNHPHLPATGGQTQASNPSEHNNKKNMVAGVPISSFKLHKNPHLPATGAGGSGQTQASNPSEHNNKKHFSRKACNYNRHEGKKEAEQVKMNFLGLPLRPGAGLCSHYMQRGTCKFGTNCKFHHPDPTSEPANSNASRCDVQESSELNFSSEPMQPAQNEQSLPLVTSPTTRTSKIIPTQGDSTYTERSADENVGVSKDILELKRDIDVELALNDSDAQSGDLCDGETVGRDWFSWSAQIPGAASEQEFWDNFYEVQSRMYEGQEKFHKHHQLSPQLDSNAQVSSIQRGNLSDREGVLVVVKGILDNLTPNKFDVVKEQLIEAGITRDDILEDVITVMFEKAVSEPTLCPMYAQLCSYVNNKLPPSSPKEPDGKEVVFTSVLLNNCHEVFEGVGNLCADIHRLTGLDQETETRNKEIMLMKLRTLGKIHLIGELLKRKIVTEKIVHHTVKMDENKQGNPDWDTFATKVFCDICTDEVLAGNRPTEHLNAIGYNNLSAKFTEKTKKGYSHEQFKSKWESLKKDYQTWKTLIESEDDQGWDPKMNTSISASPEWWAKKMEEMPDCSKFRSAPLENVTLLYIMFEDILDSTSSTTPDEANLAVRTPTESEHGAGDGNDIGIIDKQVNEQCKEAILQKSSNEEHSSTKPETSCTHAELNRIVNSDENVNPSNSATSTRVVDRVGSNISEVMELVVDAGVEEGSDEHFIATQLFVRPEYREMFLTLKTPRGRLGWLKKMCQVKE